MYSITQLQGNVCTHFGCHPNASHPSLDCAEGVFISEIAICSLCAKILHWFLLVLDTLCTCFDCATQLSQAWPAKAATMLTSWCYYLVMLVCKHYNQSVNHLLYRILKFFFINLRFSFDLKHFGLGYTCLAILIMWSYSGQEILVSMVPCYFCCYYIRYHCSCGNCSYMQFL